MAQEAQQRYAQADQLVLGLLCSTVTPQLCPSPLGEEVSLATGVVDSRLESLLRAMAPVGTHFVAKAMGHLWSSRHQRVASRLGTGSVPELSLPCPISNVRVLNVALGVFQVLGLKECTEDVQLASSQLRYTLGCFVVAHALLIGLPSCCMLSLPVLRSDLCSSTWRLWWATKCQPRLQNTASSWPSTGTRRPCTHLRALSTLPGAVVSCARFWEPRRLRR